MTASAIPPGTAAWPRSPSASGAASEAATSSSATAGRSSACCSRAPARAARGDSPNGVRSAVSVLRIPAGEGTIRPTVSLGVAAALPGDGAAELMAKADAALYRAKRSGRNRVSAAGRSACDRHSPRHEDRRLRT